MAKSYPFKFLNSYTQEDLKLFYGRQEEIDALYEMIFQTNILMVYGASGTGKTSLIQCGLAGKFKPHDWLTIYVRRGTDLNESLDKAIKKEGGTKGIENIEESLGDIYLNSFRPIYFIFDQFEELFILGTDKKEQEQFIQTVKAILTIEQPVKMIFSIREEYVGHLYEFEKQLPQLMRKKLRVELMDETKIKQVILGPIEGSNITLEGDKDKIATAIFEKVRGEEKTLTIQLPYLQVFLYKLYQNTKYVKDGEEAAVFNLQAIEKIGKLGDILREFLEEQVKAVSQKLSEGNTKVTEENVWAILSSFATLEGTKDPITMQVLLVKDESGLAEKTVKEAVQLFTKNRILKLTGDDTYELLHDSLAGKIAARRSNAQVELIEVRQLIQNQLKQQKGGQEFFSDKQLQRINAIYERLKLEDKAAIRLIHDSKKELNKKRRRAIIQAVVAIICLAIFSIFMVFAYFKMQSDKKKAVEATEQATKDKLSAKESAARAQKALNDLKMTTALNTAKAEESYGDSYNDNNNIAYARDSYKDALAVLDRYIKSDSTPQLQEERRKSIAKDYNRLESKYNALK